LWAFAPWVDAVRTHSQERQKRREGRRRKQPAVVDHGDRANPSSPPPLGNSLRQLQKEFGKKGVVKSVTTDFHFGLASALTAFFDRELVKMILMEKTSWRIEGEREHPAGGVPWIPKTNLKLKMKGEN